MPIIAVKGGRGNKGKLLAVPQYQSMTVETVAGGDRLDKPFQWLTDISEIAATRVVSSCAGANDENVHVKATGEIARSGQVYLEATARAVIVSSCGAVLARGPQV